MKLKLKENKIRIKLKNLQKMYNFKYKIYIKLVRKIDYFANFAQIRQNRRMKAQNSLEKAGLNEKLFSSKV